jgi:hypothetical protein
MALGYHVMCSLKDGRVIAPSVRERRLLARVVLEVTRGRGLLAFAAPDTHLHMEMVEEREAVGELTRRIEISAVQRLQLPIASPGPTSCRSRHSVIWRTRSTTSFARTLGTG